MQSVEALLFDLDGTLVDSKKDIALSVHHLQQKYGRPLSSEDDIARFIGDGIVKLVQRAIGREQSEADAFVHEAVDVLKKHYSEHALDNTCAYPGVAATLEHFRDKKMAVVTNKPTRVSIRILEGLGLAHYFSIVIGGDTQIRKKPDPEGLLVALEKLNVAPSRHVLMVGDSPQDVLAGRAAKISTCGIPSNIGDMTALKAANPDFTIHSMQDLTRIIH